MENKKRIIIAIDGYSSCGKSTMAKDLARTIGYTYIDSGAMYRAVTLYCLQQGIIAGETIDTERLEHELAGITISFVKEPATGKQLTCLNGTVVEQEIRGMEVSRHVSAVSKLAFVRSALTAQQRRMGEARGIVMDGRDIGTAVFPQAELKIFVTAGTRTRAQRRADEMKAAGKPVDIDEIERNIALRDHNDMTREISPLRRADDAVELDNSHMTIAEQNEWLLAQYRSAMQRVTDEKN